MKKFGIYALLIVAFWIFSDMITYISMNGAYKTKEAKIYVSTPEITITENKATYVNGVIKGNIKNNTQKIIDDVYLKIDMYSSRDNNLGTKYIKINNLQANASREFEMWYKFTDVDYLTITTTKDVENITEEELSSQRIPLALFLGRLMLFYFVP